MIMGSKYNIMPIVSIPDRVLFWLYLAVLYLKGITKCKRNQCMFKCLLLRLHDCYAKS